MICVTPTSPTGIPWKAMVAGWPATVTVTESLDWGSRDVGVPEAGDAPSASDGVTCPSPVMNSVVVAPRAALENGAAVNPFVIKIPGAAGTIFSV